MAQISSTEQKGMQQIDLTTLNIQQLSTLKQQLDQNSGETLEKVTPESEGRKFWFRLTGSVSFFSISELSKFYKTDYPIIS
ncbi:hypothetical protein NQ317_019165 [Molorchus minor]|uniref:Uncharacterized protein n=1 Tax=Molorchus minor TaxID=1323400 RepID=A0ABQ9J9B9_9CUCU|nr:hypothetical protein NQ317_019165 [Molorchus minor]